MRARMRAARTTEGWGVTRRGQWLYAAWAVAILAVSVVQLVVGNGLFWLVFAVLMICGTWLMQRAGRQDRRHR